MQTSTLPAGATCSLQRHCSGTAAALQRHCSGTAEGRIQTAFTCMYTNTHTACIPQTHSSHTLHTPCAHAGCTLVQLLFAIETETPIVGVCLSGGPSAYDFAGAATLLTNLDSQLEPRAPECVQVLRENKVDLLDAAWKLGSTIPHAISARHLGLAQPATPRPACNPAGPACNPAAPACSLQPRASRWLSTPSVSRNVT